VISGREAHVSGHSVLRRGRRPRRSARRWLLITAGTLAAAGVLAACASSGPSQRGAGPARSAAPASQPGPAAPKGTVRHDFAPPHPGGAPLTGVAAHRSGTCFTSSITVRDRLAYRCFAANQILDPCFAAARSARTLYCYADPWRKPTALRVSRALPAATATSAVTRPWAIELPGGNRCLVLTGTVPQARGVALGYRCEKGTAGLTRGTGRQLAALYRAPSGALSRVPVVAEWTA
jgi:hypothetical protein